MTKDSSIDILILSNGPGEVTTWVRPVVRELRKQLGEDRDRVRISVVLSPCPHATGKETKIVRSYPEVDRVQSPQGFWSFLLGGKTRENWDWRDRGLILFLGGDQIFPVILGKRLGYTTIVYAEWEARWRRWLDHFGVMNEQVIAKSPPKYHHKLTVVGDLMSDVSLQAKPDPNLIGILPGSKPAKLFQGVPLTLAIAEAIYAKRPQTRFFIPVAPGLSLAELAQYGNPDYNPIIPKVGGVTAKLKNQTKQPFLETSGGLQVPLIQQFPAYTWLAQACFCLTTVGANTAELGALGVPMIVLLPTQQLDAMRAWDGIPGILANLPGVGSGFAKLINTLVLRQGRLFAWANIWAQREIVPELVGQLQPEEVAQLGLDWLEHPEKLAKMRQELQQVRGEAGAASKLVGLVLQALG